MSLTTALVDDHMSAESSTGTQVALNSSSSLRTPSGTHYTLSGPEEKELICCVHGIGSDHTCWNLLIPDLVASGYRVLTYDLIGRGYSDFHSSSKFGEAEHIDQLHQILQHVGVQGPVQIIAHSMGGAIATCFAKAYPDMVKSLVLLAPAGLMSPGLFYCLRNLCCCLKSRLRDGQSRADKEKIWRQDYFHTSGTEYMKVQDEAIAYMHKLNDERPAHNIALWDSIFQFPLFGIQDAVLSVAANPNISVFILWGVEDKAVPFSNLSKWSRLLGSKDAICKNFETKVYRQARHGFFIEYSRDVNPEIIRYLQIEK